MQRDDLGRYDLDSLLDGICIAWSMHLGVCIAKEKLALWRIYRRSMCCIEVSR